MNMVSDWFKRHFSDPQVVLLVLVLVLTFAAIILFGDMLTPAIAAIVIAFLLDGPAGRLRNAGLSNLLSSMLVFVIFISAVVLAIFIILPPLSRQVTQFVALLPTMLGRFQEILLELPASYPGLVTEDQMLDIMARVNDELLSWGQKMVEFSFDSLTSLIVIAVYLVLVPVMVFFFLKDKQAILGWVTDFLPRQRSLVDQVWSEVLGRTGDYARGKVYEIIIVGCTAWITFYFLDLRFAGLLAVITGLSVIVPYIGAAVVTLPVAFVAFFQWGAGSEFLIAVGAYLVLQALDGNVLVPLLFSEVVKLHPNAIILSILIFGGIWGFWGVFFAIPLATLAHAVIKAWPRQQKASAAEDSG